MCARQSDGHRQLLGVRQETVEPGVGSAYRYALDRLVRRSPWLWAPITVAHHENTTSSAGRGGHGGSGPGSSPTGGSVSRPRSPRRRAHRRRSQRHVRSARDQTVWCWGVGFGKDGPLPIPVKIGKLVATPASCRVIQSARASRTRTSMWVLLFVRNARKRTAHSPRK